MRQKAGRKGAGFSISAEARTYLTVLRQHWPLVLSIGLFFGWLLSFPLQGPILGSAAAAEGSSPMLPVIRFLAGHFVGLVSAGILGYFFQKALKWFALGSLVCLLLSVAAMETSVADSEPLFALMGLVSGPLVISWGAVFTRSVLPNQRGRTIVMGIAEPMSSCTV